MTSESTEFEIARLSLGDFSDLNTHFEERSRRFAALPALTASDQTITFATLDSQSRNFAAHLQSLTGINAGDRVAVMMNNCIEYAVAAWGVLRAGMVLVNINPMYTQRELVELLVDSEAKVLLTERGCSEKVSSILDRTRIEHIYLKPDEATRVPAAETAFQALDLRDALNFQGPYTRPIITGESLAMLQYTGGTTGLIKGAMLSHANLLANSLQSWLALENIREAQEIVIVPLPLYHIYAFGWGLLVFLMHGCHIVLTEDPRQTDRLIDAMKRFPFTCFFGLNSLFVSLLQNPRLSSVDFSAVHITLSGGAPLSMEIAQRWESKTGCKVYEGYGLTEASPVVSVNTPRQRKLGTVGRPVPATELRLIDNDGGDCPPGMEGELCVRGPQIMQGYWRQEQETKKVLSVDGWLRTGDIASIDADGFIKILDRKKDVVIVSGFNVYPTEIDQVASHHPDVLECAALGVADDKSGQSLTLFVVSKRPDLEESELKAFCRERLAAYKVPKRIVFVDALPKSPVGKILRRKLQ